ncbi:MAG: hypothetical protein DRP78_07320, partial [Candidatus Omnitrophota bacterium]
MKYLILLLISLFPLICRDLYPCFAIGFNFFLCALILIYMLIYHKLSINRRIFILSALFAGITSISYFFSVNRFNTYQCLMDLFVALSVFTFMLSQRKKEIKFLISAGKFVCLFIALRALYQYFFGFAYILEQIPLSEISATGFYALELLRQKRVVSWFGAPNLLAGYLIMWCGIICGCVLDNVKNKKLRQASLDGVILIILFAALVCTKSIAAFLGLIAGLFFAGMILSKKSSIIPKRNRFAILGRPPAPHFETFFIRQILNAASCACGLAQSERSNLQH